MKNNHKATWRENKTSCRWHVLACVTGASDTAEAEERVFVFFRPFFPFFKRPVFFFFHFSSKVWLTVLYFLRALVAFLHSVSGFCLAAVFPSGCCLAAVFGSDRLRPIPLLPTRLTCLTQPALGQSASGQHRFRPVWPEQVRPVTANAALGQTRGAPSGQPEGWVPQNPEKWVPEGWGGPKGGALRVGAPWMGASRVSRPKSGPKGRGPNISRFFPLPPQFSFLLPSLGGLLVELWARFKAEFHTKCGFGLLWGHHARARAECGLPGVSQNDLKSSTSSAAHAVFSGRTLES